MLDVLWLIILNYGIHSIGRSAVERSVGVGKKLLLDWCQKELSADFDPRNTLSYNLCTGDWLLKLLKLYTDVQTLPEERGDQYRTLLQATEEQLGIKQNILNPADIVEGTVDEHTLMIYVSLLKRKVGGEEQLDISEDSLDRVSPKPPIASPASPSLERRRSSPSRLHSSVEADDNSEDWFSSSNGSIKSGSGDPPVSQEGESLLIQTITERVSQHIAIERDDDDDEESNVSVLSGSISQTSAPSKREVIDIDLSSQPQEKNIKELPQGKEAEQTNSEPDEDSTLVTTQEEVESKHTEVLETVPKEENPNFEEKFETEVIENKEDSEATVLKHISEREPLHTVSLTVNRSREFGTSVDETKQKQDLENRKKAFQEEMEREAKQKKEDHERGGGSSESLDPEADRSAESMEEIFTEGIRGPQNFFPGFGRGMPIFVMPGQSSSPEMMLLLQALRQARHEANYHDKEANGDTEETVPKLHTLLNLDEIDDQTPSVTPQMSQRSHTSQSQNGRETPVSDSERTPRKKQPSPTISERSEPFVHFQNGVPDENDAEKEGKRGILEVVSETIEPRLEYYDLSRTNISENEKRRFPRVNITEPLKERIKKAAESPRSPRERSKDRKSPERSSGYRSRSLTPGSGYDEEQTMPKSILKDRSKSPLDSISPERRERLLRQTDDPVERSPRSSFDRSPRSSYEKSSKSPRSSLDRALERDLTHSPRSSMERSPRSSTDILSSRDWSPRSPRLSPDRTTAKERSSNADLSPRSPRTPRSPRAKSPMTDDGLEEETSPGRSSRDTDPNRRLVRVLNRELELLKLKMDVLEKSNTTDDAELEDIDKVTKRLSEKVQERLGRSPDRSPTRRQSSRSPEFSRGRMYRRKFEDDASSSIRSRSDTRVRSSVNFDQPNVSSGHMSRSLQDLSISEALDGKISFAPSRKGKPISLGYSSPIRKVSEEIWGMNSADNVGYDPEKIAKWKKLVRKPHASDEDVIEIKQALATAITENDILQAKLKNANSEIEEKMSKTNDVLNDCRTHLAKSQAENMELRTQLEKEKTRNDSIMARIRELDKQLATSKSQNDELERQLENMTTLLQGASKKDVPTIQSMAEERDNYKGVLANTQRENTQLKEDLIREKKLTGKQQNMINDLKNILDDARKERNQMFAEISRLQKQGQLTKVTGIISRYIDQGLYDDTDGEEDEEEPINGLKKSSHTTTVSSRGNSFYLAPNESYTVPRARVEQPPVPQVTSTPYRSRSESLGQNRRIYDDSFSTPSRVTPSRSASLNMSGIKPMSPSPASSHQRAASYDFEKSSPAASIGGHEIYPHRRSNSFRSNFTPTYDVNDDDNMDDLEVQKYLSKQPAGKLEYENDEDYNQQVPRKEFHRTKSPNVTKSPMGRGLSFSDLSSENKAKKQLLYSPYLMNKGPNGLTNRSYLNHSPYDNTKETVDCIIESPIDNRYKDDYQKFSSQRVEYGAPSPDNDKSFLKALEHAVQQESNSIQKIYDELNLDYVPTRESRNTSTSYSSTLPRGRKKSKSPSPSRSSSGLKGILKNTKSETNLNIKEGRTTPVHRSTYSHSASPARTPTQELNSYGSRFGTTDFSSGKSGSSVGKSLYTTPIKRSASLRAPRDMYDDSLGTKSTSLRYKHQPFGEPPSLSDAERRYADLLVAKYTKQHGFGRTVML